MTVTAGARCASDNVTPNQRDERRQAHHFEPLRGKIHLECATVLVAREIRDIAREDEKLRLLRQRGMGNTVAGPS